MDFSLPADAVAAGYRLVAFETIGSTNAEALERARAGDPGPLWLVTSRQTAGRGRRGAAWSAPPGNLAATLLITSDLPPATLAQLGFVAGVALVEALDAKSRGSGLGGGIAFRLKWPNDVLVDGAKLAGILLQTEETAPDRAGARRSAVAVGIGVNVVAAPGGLPYPVASLAGLGREADAAATFAALASAWVEADRLWDEGRGFPALREVWLRRAAGLGRPVTVTAGSATSRGTFETIDGKGQLVLLGPDGGRLLVSAGEVHFGEARSAAPEVVA